VIRETTALDDHPAGAAHAFRAAMGHFATGVAVVGATDPRGVPHGSTANAVSSVSLNPPLLLVCMRRESVTSAVLREAGQFSVNLLEAGQAPLARRFASSDDPDGWGGVDHHRGVHGAPLLDRAVATIEASVHEIVEGGDHHIIIGRTLRVAHADHHVAPLLFYRGEFTEMGRPLPAGT
jgi:flavin reductase (DIM6/NTAB) family NADH-FMN oxidoreductase RutF